MQPGYRPFAPQVAPAPGGSTPTRRPAPAGAAQQLGPGAPLHFSQQPPQQHQQHPQQHQQQPPPPPQQLRYAEQDIRNLGRTPAFQLQSLPHVQQIQSIQSMQPMQQQHMQQPMQSMPIQPLQQQQQQIQSIPQQAGLHHHAQPVAINMAPGALHHHQAAPQPMGHPGHAVHPGHPGHQGHLVHQVHPGHAGHAVHPGHPGHPGHAVHPGHPGHHMPQQMHPQHQAAAAAAAVQQQMAQQQAQQQQNLAMEAAKRRSRKPMDKTIPDGVDTVIIGDGVQRYRDLRDFERRLDATMTRKRLDVVDSIQRSGANRYKTLRIWITNTVENQPWQTGGVNVDNFDFATNAEASYRVKIEGRLLDDGEGEGEGESKEKEEGDDNTTPTRHHLTQFFRAITIEYNAKKSAPADSVPKPIEWKRPETRPPAPVPGQPIAAPAAAATPVPEYDELTFKRPGDANVNVTINLFRHEDPERFELDAILAEIVDMKEATRAEAVMGLFEYIRLQGLQEDEEKRNFRCDDVLKQLVGSDIGYIPMLYEYVNKHIRLLPPVQLAYTIRVDEAFHNNGQQPPQPTVYDVRVAVEDPLRAQLRPFVQSPQYMGLLRDVGVLDEQLAVLVQAIGMSKTKHEFQTALARDPAGFVRQWLSSQKRDLEIILGESVRGVVGGGVGGAGVGGGDQSGEAWWRRGGAGSVWASQTARESVNLLLAKQPLIPRAA